jgi:hypothetical protein
LLKTLKAGVAKVKTLKAGVAKEIFYLVRH